MDSAQFQAQIRSNPGGYVRKVLGAELEEYQERIIRSVFKVPKTSVKSCHGIGKSFTAGKTAMTFLAAYEDSIVLTTAPTWRQVQDVLWKEIGATHANALVDLGGEMLGTRYNLGPEWFALGLSTDDPNRFQGYHAKAILIIVDESSGVKAPIFHAIEGIGSTAFVRILELGNPTDPASHFSQTFTSPFYAKISIGCFDTPNFAPFRALDGKGEYDEKASILRLYESTPRERADAVTRGHLIAPEWVYQRLIEWEEDSPMFQARCLGHFPDEGDDTLISLAKAEQARWRTLPDGMFECLNRWDAGETEVLGVDVARFGNDQTVLAYRKGNRVERVIRYRKQDLMKTVSEIVDFRAAHPWCKVHVDDTGVGGGVTDRLREIGMDGVAAFNVGSAARNKELFGNQRAELYWKLRVLFQEGDILIPDDDDLVNDLTCMRKRINLRQQIMIEGKQDMKKRGLESPDSADAVMLAFAPSPIGAFDRPLDDDFQTEADPKAERGSITGGLLRKVF